MDITGLRLIDHPSSILQGNGPGLIGAAIINDDYLWRLHAGFLDDAADPAAFIMSRDYH
jgi:hypothetical protein